MVVVEDRIDAGAMCVAFNASTAKKKKLDISGPVVLDFVR